MSEDSAVAEAVEGVDGVDGVDAVDGVVGSLGIDGLLGDVGLESLELEDSPQAEDTSISVSALAELQAEIQRLRDEIAVRDDMEDQIRKMSKRVDRLASDVESCESAVEDAKGDLKSARERYEIGMQDLRSMLKDHSRGQMRLNLGGDGGCNPPEKSPEKSVALQVLESADERINSGELNTDELTVTADASVVDDHTGDSISVLSVKSMVKLAGQDAWESAKNREEPFGMGNSEIETLEAAEITTVGELEKRMREDAWWHKKLPKFGEKKVAKLIESLRVFRAKYPQVV